MKKIEIKIGDQFHAPVGVVEVTELGNLYATIKWTVPSDSIPRVGKMSVNQLARYSRERNQSTSLSGKSDSRDSDAL